MERYRFSSEVAIYFVTFSVVDWLPVFVSEWACRVITESLNYCHDRKGLRINAYVIMPTHFHGILFSNDLQAQSLKSTLHEFRKFTGRTLLDDCAARMPRCYDEAFHRAGGFDRDRRFWQASLHPVQIETEEFWRQKFDYLHDNPCRKGLVTRPDYWRFSSASYWLLDRPVQNDVILNALDW